MKLHRMLLVVALIGMLSTAAFAEVLNLQVFTESGSFTIPKGVTRIEVEVRGGGGGGGAADGISSPVGGCGGGYGKGVFTVTPGSTYAVTVGAGGSGAVYKGRRGHEGGKSSFGDLIAATGGEGGASTHDYVSNCAGGKSAAPLNMPGFRSYYEGTGGAAGDGSSSGQGGTGYTNSGGNGSAGNVVVRW
ncbi:MAG: hypothetical protein KF751_20555 [Nitrospira sp.]|nr:hypothetical protein [Nitrospira sp.]